MKELTEKFINSYNSLGFNTYDEYTKNVLEEATVVKKQEKIDIYNIEFITTKVQIEEISKIIDIKEKLDLSEIENKLAINSQKLQDIRDRHIKVKGSLDNNMNVQNLLIRNSKDLIKQIDIYIAYDELTRTASVNFSGKRKL